MLKSIWNLTPYDPGLTIEQLEKKIGKKITKLSANESLWGPSPKIYEALQQAWPKVQYYPDGAALQLKGLLAAGWDLPQEHFCLGNGADELIFILVNTFLNQGDEVLIPTPTFSSYATAAQIVGSNIRFIAQNELTFHLAELAEVIHPETKMVFLCNPNNPTGTIFAQSDLELFLARIPAETLVILDEAYCHFANDPQYPDAKALLRKHPNLIVLRTFSKVYALASLRVGYAVASPKLIREMEKVRQPYNVNTMAQLAAAAAWLDEEYLEKVIHETITEREQLTETLRKQGFVVLPSQANFVLVQHQKAELICNLLLQEGFLVRNTAGFALPDWFRITIGPSSMMNLFLDSLQKVTATLES